MGRKEGIETYTRSRLIGYAQLLQEIAQEYKAGSVRNGFCSKEASYWDRIF